MLAAPLACKVGVAGLPLIGKAVSIPLVVAVGVPALAGAAVGATTYYVVKKAVADADRPNGV